MSVSVDAAACTGCALCVLVCPEEAVANGPAFVARVDDDLCTRCLVCFDYCPNDALVEE